VRDGEFEEGKEVGREGGREEGRTYQGMLPQHFVCGGEGRGKERGKTGGNQNSNVAVGSLLFQKLLSSLLPSSPWKCYSASTWSPSAHASEAPHPPNALPPALFSHISSPSSLLPFLLFLFLPFLLLLPFLISSPRLPPPLLLSWRSCHLGC